jgi:hypothetical protein
VNRLVSATFTLIVVSPQKRAIHLGFVPFSGRHAANGVPMKTQFGIRDTVAIPLLYVPEEA